MELGLRIRRPSNPQGTQPTARSLNGAGRTRSLNVLDARWQRTMAGLGGLRLANGAWKKSAERLPSSRYLLPVSEVGAKLWPAGLSSGAPPTVRPAPRSVVARTPMCFRAAGLVDLCILHVHESTRDLQM